MISTRTCHGLGVRLRAGSLYPRTHAPFGAVLVAQGGPIRVGTQCVIRENVIIRSTAQHPVEIGACRDPRRVSGDRRADRRDAGGD